MELQAATWESDPRPKTNTATGVGECLSYNTGFYYARGTKKLSRTKVEIVRRESFYCGRQRGEIDWLIVAFDGTQFLVLEHVYSDLKRVLTKYKGLSALEAIERREKELAALTPRHYCSCGRSAILFEEGQTREECLECYHQRIGKPSCSYRS